MMLKEHDDIINVYPSHTDGDIVIIAMVNSVITILSHCLLYITLRSVVSTDEACFFFCRLSPLDGASFSETHKPMCSVCLPELQKLLIFLTS